MATFRGQTQKQRQSTFSGGTGMNRLYGGPIAAGSPPPPLGPGPVYDPETRDRILPFTPERQAAADVWREGRLTDYRRALLREGADAQIAQTNAQRDADLSIEQVKAANSLRLLLEQRKISWEQYLQKIGELQQLDRNEAKSHARALELTNTQAGWESYNTKLKGKVQSDFERLQHANQIAFSNVDTRNKGWLIDKEWGYRLKEAGMNSGRDPSPWQKQRLQQMDADERYRAAQDRAFEQWKMKFAAEQAERAANGYGKTTQLSGTIWTDGGGWTGGGGRAQRLVEQGISPRYHDAVDRLSPTDRYNEQVREERLADQARRYAQEEAERQRQHELKLEDLRFERRLRLASLLGVLGNY